MSDERRRRGTGTIEEVKGSFRFRCPDGSGGRFTSEVYATREEASVALLAFRAQVARRQLVAVGGMTLAEYWETSWEPRKAQLNPLSIRTWRSVWNSQLSKAPFAHKTLRAITRRDVREWADRMTIGRPEHPVGLLKHILNEAVADELIPLNPAMAVRRKRREFATRVESCPTPEEQAAILSCRAIPEEVRVIIAFALGSGLRPGEWRNLTVGDVHLDAAQPYVLVRKGSDASNTTKGKRTRTVPLWGAALAALEQWMQLLPTYAPKNPMGLVFPQRNGRRRRASMPLGSVRGRDAWHVYRELAGVTREVRLHDMRHAAATDLLEGRREGGRRWLPQEVQRLLGHAQFSTTEKYYLHPTDEMVFRAAREAGSGPRTVQERSTAGSGEVQNALKKRKNVTVPGSTSPRSPSLSRPLESALYEGFRRNGAPNWTQGGLTASARQLLVLLLEGGRVRPGEMESLARQADAADLAASPLRQAVARVLAGGGHQRSAFLDLLDLLIPDAPVEGTGEQPPGSQVGKPQAKGTR